MTICTEFWTNFWPNFVSTIAGLVLGLPIAIWTNHFINKKQLQNLKHIERERLIKALTVLRDTMTENRNKLSLTIWTLNQNQVQFDTQIDGSAWDVVKPEIIQVLHDSELKRKLAYHFAALSTLIDLNKMYLNLNVGVNTTISGMEATKTALKNNIINGANNLTIEINEIETLINNELN